MDNIRNLAFMLKSCIPCDEHHCPTIRERLEQHLVSHHSTGRRASAPSYQSNTPSKSSLRTINVPIINSDEPASTTDTDRGRKSSRKPSYREALEKEVLVWAEDLPRYSNLSAENLKQNIVYELIEKVNRLKPEADEDYYDTQLSREVSKFLDSLPSPDKKKRDPALDNLKEKLIDKINELNRNSLSKESSPDHFGRKNKLRRRPKIRNSGTSTTLTKERRNNRANSIATNTTHSSSSDGYTNKYFNGRKFQNKYIDDENPVDAQVQQDVSNTPPYYGKTYAQSRFKTNKQQKTTDLDENFVKEKLILPWMVLVIKKSERKIEQNDKIVLTEVLFNRLRPLYTKQMDSQKLKLIIKGEILNFLYDYFRVAVDNDSAYFNKLVESLAIRLLIENNNSELPHSGRYSKYSYCCTDQTRYNTQNESHFKPIFYNIIKDALEDVIMSSESIENDMTEILLHNMDRIRARCNQDFKEDLRILLKYSTDLCDNTIANIINVIIDQLLHVLYDNTDDCNLMQNIDRPPWYHVLSVYKSEFELRSTSEYSTTCIQRYSDLIKRSEPKLNAEERPYKERISALIAAWVKILPKKRNKAEDTIIKETIISSLAIDILDQVKLEAVAPEKSNDREKYFSFFVYRWLNRFEYFDDINNAKSYVDKLIKKIIEIPMPAHKRQQMKNKNNFLVMTAYSESILSFEEIIEDEISDIINSQPSKIFTNADKEIRKQQVNGFALDIKNSFVEKMSSKDMTIDIVQWLNVMIKPEETEYFNVLKEQLAEKLNCLLRGRTSDIQNQDIFITKEILRSFCESNTNEVYEPENQLKQFLAKYIDHYYDVENSIAREAFGHLLKIEFQKLRGLATEVDNNNFPENEQYFIFTPESLSKELKYINIISDWLKMLPLPSLTSFNRIGNRHRIEFLKGLAKNINVVEKSRYNQLTGIEYNVYLASIINEFADKLPISSYERKNMPAMINDLVRKIVKARLRFCWQNANCEKNSCSKSSTNIPVEQLSYFIEEYIHENREELSNDEFKLEVLSARLFEDIVKMRSKNPAALYKPQDNQELGEAADESVRRLSLELCYAKEISECLNNLPLLSNTDKVSKESRIKMISNLAQIFYEKWQSKYNDPNNIYFDTDLSEYISLWISELPLDTSIEIDESIIKHKLLNRINRVNKQKIETQVMPQTSVHNNTREMSKFPYTCCNVTVSSHRRQDPGAAIVEAIENWCAELPVKEEGGNENTDNLIKYNIATELYKKVSELNMNPKCFTDNNLYRELLSKEIDVQLGILPQNSKLQALKQELKQQLTSSIMEKRIKMREQASSTEYKQELEKTIELSLPNPVHSYQEESPGFKIYKNRLAAMFIVENFDYGYDDAKENYQKQIKKEIDKYSQEILKRNAIPLTKDQIYNELYSALYTVPLPNHTSIAEEVEIIKTKCEIDNWFNTLPLRLFSCTSKVLAKDQILDMLAKRIHRMENYEQNADCKIHKEITKWLLKFSFLPGHENNVDEFAHKLLQKLKSTSQNRKCTQRNESVYIDKFIQYKNKTKDRGIMGTSQIAGPSSEFEIQPSPSCCLQISSPSPTQPGDIILSIVETWCQQLPLPANTPQERDSVKLIKDNLFTKIIMKISELNRNHETLSNDYLYNALLDDELEKLFATLPTSYEFYESKQLRKNQLEDAIQSVKPLLKKEKVKYEYKQELQNIVEMFLEEPQNKTPKVRALFNSLKDDIINNFIIYNYHKNDEDYNFNKIMVNVAVDKYFTEVSVDKDMMYDPLMVGNHLLCEMAKVPVPNETAVLEEIREIRIKFEITEFFNDQSLCNSNDKLLLRNQIISSVARRIFLLDNHCRMRNEIMKCLTKLDEKVNPEKVDALVNRLINLPETETSGKSEGVFVNPFTFTDDDRSFNQSFQTPTQNPRISRFDQDLNTDDGQWMSLLSVTPEAFDPVNNATYMTRLEREKLDYMQRSQFNRQVADKMMESKLNYSDFKKGVALTSSIREDQEPNDFSLVQNSSSCTPNDQAKNVIPSDSGNLKCIPYILSNQNSEFMQNISLEPSISLKKSNKMANAQQNLLPFNAFQRPQPPCDHQNQLGQRNTLPDYKNQISNDFPSSTPHQRTTECPASYVQNQATQNENIRQPLEKTTYLRVPQQTSQVPQHFSQQVPNLALPDNNLNESHLFSTTSHDKQGTTKQEKSQFSTPKLSINQDESANVPSSIEPHPLSKISVSFRKFKEPSTSQSLSSNLLFATPKRPLLLDSKVPCGGRRPSILFFKPSDVISESIGSALGPHTNRKNLGTECQHLAKEDKNKIIYKCDSERKRLCKGEIQICRLHKKNHCKICNDLGTCRYPGFYFTKF